MPNGDSPSAPWDEKKSPQEKPIQQKDMLTDITSIFRREEYSTNTSFFTNRKAKEYSALLISRKQRSRLETFSCSFAVNGTPTIHQAPRDGKVIESASTKPHRKRLLLVVSRAQVTILERLATSTNSVRTSRR